MKRYLLIAISCILFSCNEEKNGPGNILPREKFKTLLVDMYRIEGQVSGQALIDDKADDRFREAYKQLFKKNGTDSLQVRQTMEYYRTQPEEFKILIQEVNTTLRNLPKP